MSFLCRKCANYPGSPGQVCKTSGKYLKNGSNPSCGMFEVKESQGELAEPLKLSSEAIQMVELLLKDSGGNEKVIERHPKGSPEAIDLIINIENLKRTEGDTCPFSYRYNEYTNL